MIELIGTYIQVIAIHGDRINTFSHFATAELIDLAWVVYVLLITGSRIDLGSKKHYQSRALVDTNPLVFSTKLYDA